MGIYLKVLERHEVDHQLRQIKSLVSFLFFLLRNKMNLQLIRVLRFYALNFKNIKIKFMSKLL